VRQGTGGGEAGDAGADDDGVPHGGLLKKAMRWRMGWLQRKCINLAAV
jgi:hypothetical protein